MVMRSRLLSLLSLLIHTVIFLFSSHTNHTKQSIHYSQFLRLRCLCSDDKDDPETSAIFTDKPLISFRRNKNTRDNLVRSALDKIYLHQRVPFLAHVLVVTRVRSSTLPHLFPDLNRYSAHFCMHLLQHHLLHFLH